MPDSTGRFRGISLSGFPNRWLDTVSASTQDDDPEPELDTEEPPFDIVWTPPAELDGAWFQAE